MRAWAAILSAAVLAGPVSAGDAGVAVTTVSATGDGAWEIICHAVKPGGEQVVRILNAGRNRYTEAGLLRASCDVKNANKALLVVAISAPAMKCPFKVGDADACEQTFEKGRAGSFELRAKATR